MNTESLKKLSIQVMIGSLIGAAAIAVFAVLAGSFNDTFGKALGTLVIVMLHALLCLGYVEQTHKKQNTDFKFFENSVFFLIVVSFFTSIFGIWGLLSGEIVGKLYGTYFVLLFAALHGQMLTQTTGKQSNIDNIVYANYFMMFVVIALLLPLIWLTGGDEFPSVYYRVLAAFGIVDATLTILAVILHKMYIQKHPEIKSTIFAVTTKLDATGKPVPVQATEQPQHKSHPLLWILGIFLFGQLLLSVIAMIMGAAYR